MSERILIATTDADSGNFIAQQVLIPQGYTVETVPNAVQALRSVVRFSPNLIIADLNLPDLSGKDLLVALAARGHDIPVIVISNDTQEGDILQAFRLGAVDFLNLPAQVGEVATTIDRILRPAHLKISRFSTNGILKQTNQELRQRILELRQVVLITKDALAANDQKEFFNKILAGAITLSKSNCGWILFNGGNSKQIVLAAAKNLPASINQLIGKAWDETLSVGTIYLERTCSLNGADLKHYSTAEFGKSILITPLKNEDHKTIGALALMRHKDEPFGPTCQKVVELLAELISIYFCKSKINISSNGNKRKLQSALDAFDAVFNTQDITLRAELEGALTEAVEGVMNLLVEQGMHWSIDQRRLLLSIQDNLLASLSSLDNKKASMKASQDRR